MESEAHFKEKDMRDWGDLDAAEQLALREAYQAVLDAEPKTCSLDDKVSRFANWLAEREIRFSKANLGRKAYSAAS